MKGWRKILLKEVAKIERNIVEATAIKSGTLYAGLENIVSGGDFLDVRKVQNGELSSSKFCFTPKHLLYGKLRPYLAKIARPDFEGICSTDILPVLPSSELSRDFLFHFLLQPSMVAKATSRATGANLPRLSPKALAEIEISIPTLPEQKRIAAILDKADAIRRKRQQAIKLADEFLHATFLNMFGDPKAKNPKTQPVELGKITQIVMGQSPKGDSYNTNGIGVPLLNGPAEFGIKYPKERQWTTEPKKYSKPGDILFCVRGATAGRLNLADKEYCIGRGLAAIRPKRKISSEFIYKYLEFMYQRFQESSDGSTFINIPSNILNTLPVPDPSKTEEKQFTSIAKAIDILKNRHETSLKDSETCFNSLTQRAFRGEL